MKKRNKSKMIFPLVTVMAIGLIVLSVIPSACRPVEPSNRYEIVDLGVLSGYETSYAYDINEFDQVVGASGFSDQYNDEIGAFLWENGRISELKSLPGARSSEAVAINDHGQIVGYTYVDDPGMYGFYAVFWQNGSVFDLGRLSNNDIIYSFASDINNAGIVVGSSATSSWNIHAFLYDTHDSFNHIYPNNNPGIPNRMQDIGTLGGLQSWATCINNNGQIVGESETKTGSINVFLYNICSDNLIINPGCGRMIDLGNYPAGSMGRMFASINDHSQIVFELSVYNEIEHRWEIHVVCWENGIITDLGTLPGSISAWATDINNAGQVVGWSSDGAPNWNPRAFLWENGQMINLNDEFASHWDLQKARGINDAGSIVGVGINPQGEQHGFILKRNL